MERRQTERRIREPREYSDVFAIPMPAQIAGRAWSFETWRIIGGTLLALALMWMVR